MKYVLLNLIISFFLGYLISCSTVKQVIQTEKIKGVSFVASPREIDSTHLKPIKSIGADWISIMPFAFMRSLNEPKLIFNIEKQWWGERLEGAKETIRLAKEDSLRVCIKPQIWIGSGEFTGEINFDSESKWIAFEDSYSDFIMTYVNLAEEMKVDYLCIGTELENFIEKRPAFWNRMIASIRSAYSGKLTYAENWDCYAKVPFWSKLDAIGIDAYFPLSEARSPSVSQLSKSWKKYLSEMQQTANACQKPIVFTEYGYRSMDFTAKKPWDFSENHPMNETAQTTALKALYENCWKQPWFGGGFLWKWFPNSDHHLGENDTQFSPQGKKAEEMVRAWYLNH